MTVRDRVTGVVFTWCGLDPFDTGTALSAAWGQSAQAGAIPFTPNAVSRLIQMLAEEFNETRPDARDFTSWNPGAFNPPGSVDSVDSLVASVQAAPPLGMRRVAP
jgi:hypothetical protein